MRATRLEGTNQGSTIFYLWMTCNYMEEITKEIDTLKKRTKVVTDHIGISFGICKCSILVFKRRKESLCEGTVLGERVIINKVDVGILKL